MTSIISIFTFEIITFQFDLTRPLKLSILFNNAKYPKGLAPFVIYATPFYNSKTSIPNGLASPFGSRWLQLEDEVALHKEAKLPRPLSTNPTMETIKTP